MTSGRPYAKLMRISRAAVGACALGSRDGGARRDAGGAAGQARQIPLGDELLVCLDHDTAGQAQLLGQDTRRRERCLRHQPASADRPAKLLLELLVEGEGIVLADLDEELAWGIWSWFSPSEWTLPDDQSDVTIVSTNSSHDRSRRSRWNC